MATANVLVPGRWSQPGEVSHLTEMHPEPIKWMFFHLIMNLFSKDCAPFFLVILDCFPRWVNLCMDALTVGFFSSYVQWLFWGHSQLWSIAKPDIMTLVSLVLMSKAVYNCSTSLLTYPTPPGKDTYLRIATGQPWSTVAHRREEFLLLPPLSSLSFVARVLFIQFSVLSQG